MRFDKHNARVLEILRMVQPVGVKPTLIGFNQQTLAVAAVAALIAVLLLAH